MTTRDATATEANKLFAHLNANRARSLPPLSADTGLRELCDVLQAIDPNGCHTPELARSEGFDPYTLDEAWDALATMLND